MVRQIKRISKSQYLRGLQCPKALWLYRHRPDLKPEISDAQQHLFDIGHEVGEVAKGFFGEGLEIECESYEIDRAIELTEKAVGDGRRILYEATACSPDGAFSRIDILKKSVGSDGWDLVEVKAATAVKDYYIQDMALQRHAFLGAGYEIRKSILMHVNNHYLRSGDLDVKQLFTLEDCTAEVEKACNAVGGELNFLLKVVNSRSMPDIEIGDQCHDPFGCDYIGYCWAHVPDYSVYNVFRGRKLDQLLGEQILDIGDVPDHFDTTPRQFIDIDAYKRGRVHVDRPAIRTFLKGLVYPLYYLDYETINPAIPLFDRSRPYQQIPFQFSLHIQDRRNGNLTHVEFLHVEQGDPRPFFIDAVIAACGGSGSVLVYNQSFESRINRELAADFPAFADQLHGITDRMVDLIIPFRSRFLYNPEAAGSASLKAVLPAFVPDMSYDGMPIGDGGAASRAYLACIRDALPEEEKETIYRQLRAYCRQDTYAEVKLLEVLYEKG
jgi:hypothetical protein